MVISTVTSTVILSYEVPWTYCRGSGVQGLGAFRIWGSGLRARAEEKEGFGV